MEKKYIIGNWKMNKNIFETRDFFTKFNEEFQKLDTKHYVGFGVPSLHLLISKAMADQKIKIGSQNSHFEDSGAFTGEISPTMLKAVPADFAIIGHSERRQLFGETSEIVNKKMHALLENKILPVVCVGETLEEYEAKETKNVIRKQIKESLAGLKDFTEIIIAYEPIWAIGTGKTATPSDAQNICAFIREITSKHAIIQYGGSVKPNNVKELMSQKDIDGALIGGASLDAAMFIELLKNLN